MTTLVSQTVQDIVESVVGKTKMEIGATLTHPDGRSVLIVSGEYWGQRGVSNFWHWNEVKANGSLGPDESGYGWC